ncbi:sigma-54-dependent Fis family transcriptional regulator [Gephyromycinifex aptenodytis]|uniref:sigma-54-dependent Fis family transcriptional regulator n=1 Tax=Gephyromycinifex aptenodytis TaxID=2716227 RepID=UPI00144838D5|nr:helix-turn-helix domain-containing protein [Gephyromycinifex aptenodytis]
MPDSQNRILRVAAARADFLESGLPGAAGVPDLLAASWVRSRVAGVSSQNPDADCADVDTGSRLSRCAAPVIEQLANDCTDLPLAIALTDKHARVLNRVDMSAAVGRLLDRVGFSPGFNYAEGSMGTNGVGTVLEAGQPVSIVGPEHFTESLQPFACTGAPIIDPLTGRVEGILDLSTVAPSWNPLMHTLVKSAAKDIGRNMLLDRGQSQQALFETYLRVDSRAGRQAVFAFAESIFIANSAAQGLFSPAEQLAIREHATFLLCGRDRVADVMTLASGRAVQIRGTRLLSGGDTAGVVVLATEVGSSGRAMEKRAARAEFADEILPSAAVANSGTGRLIDDLRRPHEPIAGGSSPAWLRACEELKQAMSAQTPTIVVGETGSGKFTLVAELFHAEHGGGRSICIDADQLSSDGLIDLDAILDGAVTRTLCIVRNIDCADTDGVERLDNLLLAIERSRSPVSVAATLSGASLDSDLPFHTVIGHFEVSVNVPPLRCRTEDLPHIVTRILADVAPHRRVRLSPGAQRVIARYTWPRNVAQLREALVHAVRIRPVGEIQEEDLPTYCHTAPRKQLSVLEAAERDAIIEALNAVGGNRVAAAARVGMSRSSLYRKLKVYGIQV